MIIKKMTEGIIVQTFELIDNKYTCTSQEFVVCGREFYEDEDGNEFDNHEITDKSYEQFKLEEEVKIELPPHTPSQIHAIIIHSFKNDYIFKTALIIATPPFQNDYIL